MENNRLQTCIALTASLWLGSVAAAGAAEPGFYVGLTGGQASFGLTQHEIDLTLTKALELDQRFELPGVSSILDSQIDDHTSGVTGLVGYRINRGLAVEAAYVDLGKLTYRASGTGVRFVEGHLVPVDFSAHLSTEVTGTTVSLLVDLFPPKRWEVFLRGGVLFAQTKRDSSVSTDSFVGDLGFGSESSSDLLIGVGTALNLTDRWAVRLEYERFLNVGESPGTESDISLISLGLLVHF